MIAFNICENFVPWVRKKLKSAVSCLLSPLPLGCQEDRPTVGLNLRVGCRFLLLSLSLLCSLSLGANPPSAAPTALVWEAERPGTSDYIREVETLLQRYEAEAGEALGPAERGGVGLKVNTRGGRGLSTPLPLLRAVIAALEARGYARSSIRIVDYSAQHLRAAGILPPLSSDRSEFEGCPVLALDTGVYFNQEWFYDSPLPPALRMDSTPLTGAHSELIQEATADDRKSYLPAPLLFDVDFWINLAVGADDPALGVDGVLANATLWNVSNSRRFLVNQATASAAVAEIAAIPELADRMLLHVVSLESYQFIGGPFFNSIYTRSEPRLWMSGDPVALDRLIFERINAMRRLEGFPEISPVPRQLVFASSLGLGSMELTSIRIEKVPVPGAAEPIQPRGPTAREAPRFEEPPGWLRDLVPW